MIAFSCLFLFINNDKAKTTPPYASIIKLAGGRPDTPFLVDPYFKKIGNIKISLFLGKRYDKGSPNPFLALNVYFSPMEENNMFNYRKPKPCPAQPSGP